MPFFMLMTSLGKKSVAGTIWWLNVLPVTAKWLSMYLLLCPSCLHNLGNFRDTRNWKPWCLKWRQPQGLSRLCSHVHAHLPWESQERQITFLALLVQHPCARGISPSRPFPVKWTCIKMGNEQKWITTVFSVSIPWPNTRPLIKIFVLLFFSFFIKLVFHRHFLSLHFSCFNHAGDNSSQTNVFTDQNWAGIWRSSSLQTVVWLHPQQPARSCQWVLCCTRWPGGSFLAPREPPDQQGMEIHHASKE